MCEPELMVDFYIYQLRLYSSTHPNLIGCWVAYLELKKRHHTVADSDLQQCESVILKITLGQQDDLEIDDLTRLLLYKMTYAI
jgi:hypothetical protein